MDDREALVRCVTADPDDDLPRLVFADWLDEHGEHDTAAALRAATWKHSGVAALAGRTVSEVWVRDDQWILLVRTDRGWVAVTAMADCCSESWFFRIRGLAALIGRPVLGVRDIEPAGVDHRDGLGRQESDSVYGFGLVTDAGTCEIVYRNSSNGYYGGWVESAHTDDLPNDFGGRYKPMTTDWQFAPPTDAP